MPKLKQKDCVYFCESQYTLLCVVHLSLPSEGFQMAIFTTLHYASLVYAMALCLSVTSRCSAKTAKHRITQTKPHDNPGTLVF